jgi:hypothetical protein
VESALVQVEWVQAALAVWALMALVEIPWVQSASVLAVWM